MPRKAKKTTSYRPTNFSMKNTSLLSVGNAFILAEGKLSRDNIVDLSSKTLFGQLKTDNLIKETNEQGIYEVTSKFKSEFSSLTGDSRSYGGSGAGEIHSGTVSNLTAAIPKDALINGDYKNGNQLLTENRQNKKTPEFKDKINELKQEVYAAQRQNEIDYRASMSNPSLSDVERTKAEIDYFYKKDDLEMKENVLNDKRNISSPDMEISLTRSQAYEYIENLRELKEEYSKYNDEWEETISQMESYITVTEEEIITFDIEVIDSNYTRNQIQAKEYYSRVYEKPVFYFKT